MTSSRKLASGQLYFCMPTPPGKGCSSGHTRPLLSTDCTIPTLGVGEKEKKSGGKGIMPRIPSHIIGRLMFLRDPH